MPRSRLTGGWEPTEDEVAEREAWERDHGFERGCGERVEGGLYACCETSPFGHDVEWFLIDPARAWTGPGLRAPLIQADSAGTNHVILGVGSRFYPFVSDFVEETRRLGVSKRIPRNFDISILGADSKMLLTHPRSIPKFGHKTESFCPANGWRAADLGDHECLGDLWPLSLLHSYSSVHDVQKKPDMAWDRVNETAYYVTTPSVKYKALFPYSPTNDKKARYAPGVFISLPITSLQFISKKRRVPTELKEKAAKKGLNLEVCDH